VRVAFAEVRELLQQFIDRRGPIIEQIESRLLNAGRQPFTRDQAAVEQILSFCFGGARAVDDLTAMHAAAGFEIVPLEQRSHAFDAAALTLRARQFWDSHRWPGRNGRLAFARTLFAAYILRRLEHLTMRIWDGGSGDAAARLNDVQRLLDALNAAIAPRAFIRDARWLVQTAQGPLTRHPAPYFKIAEQVSSSFGGAEGVEIHAAGAKLAGGHLRSQLRYRTRESGLPLDDPGVLMVTRNSNSMDVALLVQDLVPLLEAYEGAPADASRVDLADAILQGVSADPELLLRRLDLLGPYTTIEDVFVERSGDGGARDTPPGERHRAILARYRELIARAAPRLKEDAAPLDPSRRAYSPLGLAYGFCDDLLSNLAMSPLVTAGPPALALEDMFASRSDPESGAAPEEHCDHSIEWAVENYTRTIEALGNVPGHPARLFVIPDTQAAATPPDGAVSAQEHCVTSDLQHALAIGATAFPKSQVLVDRREGRYLASAEAGGRWFCISKAVLTACSSRGHDALLAGVPAPVIDELRLTCGEILVVL